MAYTARLVTAEELERMPDDDCRYELVKGRIIEMSLPGVIHGVTVTSLASLLAPFVNARGLGVVMVETGYTLARNPDTVRGPDVSFVRRERFATRGLPRRGFWQGPPDLAVEVLSPDDRLSEVVARVEEYLTTGASVVWVVNPDLRTVTVYRRLVAPIRLSADDTLDAEDVLPGFHCAVREIFA